MWNSAGGTGTGLRAPGGLGPSGIEKILRVCLVIEYLISTLLQMESPA